MITDNDFLDDRALKLARVFHDMLPLLMRRSYTKEDDTQRVAEIQVFIRLLLETCWEISHE